MSTPILGPSKVGVTRAALWASRHHATTEFVGLARLYWLYAPERGVRPEIAYAQAYHETGGGHFGGVLDASRHNPCGLKTAAGGSDTDPNAHMRYPTWDMGVQGHLDHLASYARSPGYPRPGSPDVRNAAVLGYGATVEAMGRKWASGASDAYAQAVLAIVKAMAAT